MHLSRGALYDRILSSLVAAGLGDAMGAAKADSAPTAVGLFVFAGGDPLESIVGGANIGSDTDTIAAMAGGLAGALRGFQAVPPDLWVTLREANPEFDLESLAQGLADIAWKRVEAGRQG
jgi:ADP-ribosylglycohydrolase